MIDTGRALPIFERIVDGRTNAAETSIVLDLNGKRTGEIQYLGASSLAEPPSSRWTRPRIRSPRKSGAYVRAWFALAR
jgi:hypothetical protein